MNGTQRRTLAGVNLRGASYCPPYPPGFTPSLEKWKGLIDTKFCYQIVHIKDIYNKIFKIFLGEFQKHFGSIWKLVWVYFYLTNATPSLIGKIETSFRVILLRGSCLLLGSSLLWTTIVVHDNITVQCLEVGSVGFSSLLDHILYHPLVSAKF